MTRRDFDRIERQWERVQEDKLEEPEEEPVEDYDPPDVPDWDGWGCP